MTKGYDPFVTLERPEHLRVGAGGRARPSPAKRETGVSCLGRNERTFFATTETILPSLRIMIVTKTGSLTKQEADNG